MRPARGFNACECAGHERSLAWCRQTGLQRGGKLSTWYLRYVDHTKGAPISHVLGTHNYILLTADPVLSVGS